jgi:hypothetical protein
MVALMSGDPRNTIDFDAFVAPLLGLPVSYIWRGYGSAIFLEFGALHTGRVRRNGSAGNPKGEWTLMIEWSWRIEGKRRVWCGSWSDEDRWERAFTRLRGQPVSEIGLFGRLNELDLGLSNGLHVVSFTTVEGDPEWGLGRKTGDENIWLSSKAGRLTSSASTPSRMDMGVTYDVSRDARTHG